MEKSGNSKVVREKTDKCPVVVLAPNIWRHGPMASAVARAYNGSLEALPPAGSRGRAPGQEVRG